MSFNDLTVVQYSLLLEEMLLHTFTQIEKSKNPEENMKWFVSEDALKWYKEIKSDNIKIEKEVKESWTTKVFE